MPVRHPSIQSLIRKYEKSKTFRSQKYYNLPCSKKTARISGQNKILRIINTTRKLVTRRDD